MSIRDRRDRRDRRPPRRTPPALPPNPDRDLVEALFHQHRHRLADKLEAEDRAHSPATLAHLRADYPVHTARHPESGKVVAWKRPFDFPVTTTPAAYMKWHRGRFGSMVPTTRASWGVYPRPAQQEVHVHALVRGPGGEHVVYSHEGAVDGPYHVAPLGWQDRDIRSPVHVADTLEAARRVANARSFREPT